MNPNTTDYGGFTTLVKTAGFLVSAALALSLTWKGRARWEPSEQDVPKGAQKVGGLLCAIIALWCGVGTIVSLMIYGMLITTFTYRRQYSPEPGVVQTENVIGGFWLTREARTARNENRVPIQQLYQGSAYDKDQLWPRPALALAQQTFVLAYLG